MSLFGSDIESQQTLDEIANRLGVAVTAAVKQLLDGAEALLDGYEIQIQFVKKESK